MTCRQPGNLGFDEPHHLRLFELRLRRFGEVGAVLGLEGFERVGIVVIVAAKGGEQCGPRGADLEAAEAVADNVLQDALESAGPRKRP